MRVAFGADHAGFLLKQELIPCVKGLGHEVLDLGTISPDPVDYPDYAEAVGRAVVEGRAERAILICGSGVGASVAANKIPGVRAGLCHDSYSAHQGVEHDDMNVLVLGSRVIGTELSKDLCITFINARFTGEERHRRRLEKIHSIEQRYSLGSVAREKI